MFQVTAQDIAALNDGDLRAVIALTAEAEVRRYGFAGTSISWGGDQRANDGGVDVEARLASSPVLGMSIPRSLTGFQAKAEKMPAAKITKEMRPKGVARPIFGELAAAGGAYIIISSKENLTKTSIDERLKVMRKALSDVPGQEKLDLGFMDSSALATWVRGYAGPSVWVLNRIARRLRNWKPFSPWAYAKEGIEAPYLVDEYIRVHIPDTDPGTDSSALVALEEIRSRLRKERGSVRIVGLSGVGKTRFAQALFDERLGTAALDHTLAVYADIGNEPDPEPNSMISDLIVSGMRGVVIVDNCRPAVHRRLAETAADPASKVSLLTIEYDVRDEELEDTDVFVLNAASDALVERLLGQRFPNLSHSDIHTIAKMAGGNLRIAIAIASTGGRSGSFATLKSDDLIARLFYQGNAPDPDLLRSGNILALSYSFSVENAQSSQSELALLAELGETTVTRLYEQVRTIQERELIQQRGEFRALLPPGISNHLAQAGLKRIPPQRIRDWLARIPIRLLKSVAHRLSFLHGSPEAEQIAEEWLSPGGLLGSPDRLPEDIQQMFLYIAALRPSLALESLDRASVGLDDAQAAKLFGPYADLLHWLAYDAALFDRSVNLLVRMRAGIERKPSSQPTHDPLFNLFQSYLSGTHATVEQRIAVIEPLLAQHPRSVRFSIGVNALKSLLKADDFSGVETRFGALSRDYGLWPLGEDLKRWFRVTLSFCERLDLRGGEISEGVRTILADEMRDLWFSQMVIPELQALAKNFSKRSFWPAGWIAANSIGKWRDDKLTKRSRAALPRLVSALRPSSLRDRVLTFAERKMQTLYFEMKDYEKDYTAVERRVYEEGLRLGNELAVDLDTLRAVLPEILGQDAMIPVHPLAAGLAEKLRDPSRVWKLLQTCFLGLSDEKRKPEFLAVFLSALQTKGEVFVETILNEVSNDPEFAVSFPRIQCAVIPGANGFARLVRSIKSGAVPAFRYQVIANISDSITDGEFSALFRPLSKLADGFDACLHLIWIRLARLKQTAKKPTAGLKMLGRSILLQWDCDPHGSMMDYQLAEVVEQCMPSSNGETVVTEICERCAKKAQMSLFFLDQYPRLFTALLKTHPHAALDGLLDSGSNLQRRGTGRRRRFESGGLFAALPEKTIIDWCEKKRSSRYVLMASVIDAICEADNGDCSWQPLALSLLAKAPNKPKLLAAYFRQFRPMTWSGSRASLMERRLRLFGELLSNPNLHKHYGFIQSERDNFALDIERDRLLDRKLSAQSAATFE